MVGARILACTVALAAPAHVLAQGPTVDATVTPQPVGVNSQFVLTVEVSGAQQLDAAPSIPDLEFADYLGSGTTTSMQMINGRTTVSVILQYRFRATKEGTFTIPPLAVTAGGTTLRTEPVAVTVSTSTGSTTATRSDGSVVEIPEDALFVTATPSKRRVYVNEPVIVEYRIYTRIPVEGYTVTPPSATGFWVESLETPDRPAVESVTRDGREYASAVIGRSALFPTGAGSKTIAPLDVEAQVRVERRSRDPLDVFRGGLLADRVPVVVSTDPIEVEVVAPPAAGRPDDFTGFVGNLEVTASLDTTDARTNEALTYRVRVSGEGNVQTLPEPSVAFPEAFEVYPPEVHEDIDRSGRLVRGSKTYEYVLIPRVPGLHTIPATRYAYLDPATGRYAVAEAGPLRVSVTGTAEAAPLISAGGRGAVTTLRQDIRFIRVAMPQFLRRDRSLVRSAAFWALALAPLSLLGAAVGFRRHRDRLVGDIAFARGRKAGKAARRRLKRARTLVSPGQAKEFHAEVGKALRGFLGDKLNMSEAGMVQESVRRAVGDRGVREEALDEYFACVDLCDRYRFAPVDVTEEQMATLLERAERAMTDMERALR